MSSTDGLEIVKWYTRARRFPQLIGKTPDGATIWGGPYTYTQVIVGVLFIVAGSKTAWLWGHFGSVGNAVMLLGVAYGLVIILGRLPIGSRNPLSIAAGLVHALSSPSEGRLGGAPVRLRRPHRARSKVVITADAPTLVDVQARQAVGQAFAGSHTAPANTKNGRGHHDPRRRLPWPHRSHPAPAPIPAPAEQLLAPVTPGRLRPTPASTRTAPTPALTGVQRLLASTGTPHQED